MTIAVLTTALLSATFAGTGKTLLAKAVATESGPARESLRYFFFLQHSSHFIILHIIVYIFFKISSEK
jgi:SpoVK/Ycf46/Vps4 family AAA+-type ATPase